MPTLHTGTQHTHTQYPHNQANAHNSAACTIIIFEFAPLHSWHQLDSHRATGKGSKALRRSSCCCCCCQHRKSIRLRKRKIEIHVTMDAQTIGTVALRLNIVMHSIHHTLTSYNSYIYVCTLLYVFPFIGRYIIVKISHSGACGAWKKTGRLRRRIYCVFQLLNFSQQTHACA